jgi:tetratricopeptide (TPR) repeat protein/NAD-dependent dihydropyrimidine dehydrogenase PreA subunit
MLPVVQPRGLRPQRPSFWRALTLIAIHLVMIAHFTQWILQGVTLSPVEPSEGMEFAKHGIVNTGLVFFVAAILVTVVFGRFFCGWGCHLIALQDLSRWLLIKIGIKPKPLRSRVLGLVPLVAFVYMFLWPAIFKIAVGRPLGPVTTEFLTTDFWATFPGVVVAVWTFAVCGFVVVFVLGSKGYCTYGCPYGAAFGVADQLAPIRIRVTDACQGCATCTSVCTSNVRVHEEVRDHGMVVDPGCMKCLDCVANCPNDALYVGAGRPALGRGWGRRKPGAPSWSEEVLAGLVFVLGFVSFRGLYGLIPFLFALGIAAILAGLVLALWRLLRNRDAWLGPIRLKKDGRLRRSGWVFVVAMIPIVAFWAHSAVVQGLTRHADRLFDRTADLRTAALEIREARPPMAESDRSLVADLRRADERLERWSPLNSPERELRSAWTAYLDGDPVEAKTQVDQALRERPSEASGHLLAGRLMVDEGRLEGAILAYSRVVDLDPDSPAGYLGLGTVLGSSGRYDAALDVFTRGLEALPASLELRYNRGLSLALLGDFDGAVGEFERVLDVDPDFRPARENLAGVLAAAGRFDEAVAVFEEAVRRSPTDPQLRIMAARACLGTGARVRAERHIEAAIALDPSLEPARRLLD